MPHWDIITFDCYGTLIDWEAGIVSAFARLPGFQKHAHSPEAILAAYAEIEPEVEAESYRSYREILSDAGSRVAARLGLIGQSPVALDLRLPPVRSVGGKIEGQGVGGGEFEDPAENGGGGRRLVLRGLPAAIRTVITVVGWSNLPNLVLEEEVE